ncbi:MAG: hypothetical protein FWH02_08110 [Oscillospiraceae bacterium]|nr:hypothetical protein [Oscillospiraceae bacterium]
MSAKGKGYLAGLRYRRGLLGYGHLPIILTILASALAGAGVALSLLIFL